MLQIPIMQKSYSAFTDLIFLGVLKAELKYNSFMLSIYINLFKVYFDI